MTEIIGASNMTNTHPDINVAANSTDQTRLECKINLKLKALDEKLDTLQMDRIAKLTKSLQPTKKQGS